MGLGKSTGWPFHDLDPWSRVWHRLAKICLSAQKVRTTHLRNGWSDWCETKKKCICWILATICDFDLTHDLDLGCFKVEFRNNSISGIVGLIDVKWKGIELIWHWADCMTLPFDHTHDLDLGVSRSESEIALSQEWGGRLTMNEKDVSHPFMTMVLTCVTMVGWTDVPDSDRGDFRHRRAVDVSSYSYI